MRATHEEAKVANRYVVTLETDSPRPGLARYLKRVLREENLRCVDVKQADEAKGTET